MRIEHKNLKKLITARDIISDIIGESINVKSNKYYEIVKRQLTDSIIQMSEQLGEEEQPIAD